MTTTTVHAPGNPAHLMHVKPVRQRVRVLHGDRVLAETGDALRVMETGREPYDPVLYLPPAALKVPLDAVAGKNTHCPLKGDCSYFTLDGREIAWSYDRPLPDADIIRDRVAFYADRVTIEEIGADA